MEYELRPFWRKYFNYNWKFGLFLLVLICIPRFILVLNANETANYGYIGLIMMISAVVPFLFLSKYGLKKMGLTRPHRYSWLPISIISGLIFSVILYFIGDLFYGNSYQNWYEYIGKSYNISHDINGNEKLILFSIMAITGMIFSPIG